MKTCRKIEPLLYLYRDGELSTTETEEIHAHLSSCDHCRSILDDLRRIETALARERELAPESTTDEGLIAATLHRLSPRPGRISSASISQSVVDDLLYWLRPAMGLLLAGLAVLLIVQQSRDLNRLAGLEHRLQGPPDSRSSIAREIDIKGMRVNDIMTMIDPGLDPTSSRKFRGSAIGDNPLFFGILDVFRSDRRIFQEFEKRYPHLSSITLTDSLDDRERKILATEGKAFLMEFEQLVKQGEQ